MSEVVGVARRGRRRGTPSPLPSFKEIYDGDGNRINPDSSKFIRDFELPILKKTESSQTILYINKYYEKNLTTGVVTTNYYMGSKLIATRENTTLTYVHQDALTGTSVTTNSSGTSTGSIKYFSFGSTRSGTVTTTQKFTGQRLDSIGLYYYGARYYDPTIGRFISADTIVPNPANPQSLNRYSYCLNNPLKYTDPTGHDTRTEVGGVNDNGETWYITYDGAGNMLGISNGIGGLSNLLNETNKVETADFPVTKQPVTITTPDPSSPTIYTTVYGYYQTGGILYQGYYSKRVVVSDTGEYYQIETTGWGITDAGCSFDVYWPGEEIKVNNIYDLATRGVEISYSLTIFNLQVGVSSTFDSNGLSVDSQFNDNHVFGMELGPSLVFTKTTIKPIFGDPVDANMHSWVKKAYGW